MKNRSENYIGKQTNKTNKFDFSEKKKSQQNFFQKLTAFPITQLYG